MNERPQIRFKPLADVPRFPNFFRRIDRHIDDQRRANNILPRHKSPKPAVVGIVAIVAHHEVVAGWHHQLAVHDVRGYFRGPLRPHPASPLKIIRRGWEIFAWHIHGSHNPQRVRLLQRYSIHINLSGNNLDAVAGHADAPFDEIWIAFLGQRRAKYNDLLPLRIAPSAARGIEVNGIPAS